MCERADCWRSVRLKREEVKPAELLYENRIAWLCGDPSKFSPRKGSFLGHFLTVIDLNNFHTWTYQEITCICMRTLKVTNPLIIHVRLVIMNTVRYLCGHQPIKTSPQYMLHVCQPIRINLSHLSCMPANQN